MQTLQYKLLNRISPCRKYLTQLRIFDSDSCPFWQRTDTLSHFFSECPDTALFWQKPHDWVDRVEDTLISSISLRERLLGVPLGFPKGRRINTITLMAKYYIHRQKLFGNGDLSFIQWLQEFRSKLRVEKWVCVKMGKPSKFAPWKKIS